MGELIGQILVEKGYLNLAQLNEARRIQIHTTSVFRPPLGEVLRHMGVVTSAQIQEALKLQQGGETHG